MFKNKTILITGGTGSFGNAMLKKIVNKDFKEIRILSRDEKKQHDMRSLYNNANINFYIGDVRDYKSIDFAMKEVDYVFHAAALKQVPSCEFFPLEATYTNVLGTENILRCGINNKVSRIICLSTDKAAYPINAMGISKALMEKVAIATARNLKNHDTIINITRYGNVMASRGSVIPYFIKLIKSNSPITVTDPNMTRFLMSIDEAIELVLFAFANGSQGDLFVQKSPAATMGDLALSIKEIFNAKSSIKEIGTRHGEKLYETLCTREEMNRSIDLGEYYRIPPDNRDLNYGNYFSKGDSKASTSEDYNSHNTVRLNIEEIKSKLMCLSVIRENL